LIELQSVCRTIYLYQTNFFRAYTAWTAPSGPRLRQRSLRLIPTELPQSLSADEVSEAVDQWKMLALDSTPPEWKCNSRKAHPAIDEVWRHVLSRRNAVGNLKYCTLAKVVKVCVVFPHGNVDEERSFSANNNTVTVSIICAVNVLYFLKFCPVFSPVSTICTAIKSWSGSACIVGR